MSHLTPAQFMDKVGQCSGFFSEGGELRRDRLDAERLAKRWPGKTPEEIQAAARARSVELGRRCKAKETELGL